MRFGIDLGISHPEAAFVLDGANLVRVILPVGGTTRIPYVKKALERFGQPARRISGPRLSSVPMRSEVHGSRSRKQ